MEDVLSLLIIEFAAPLWSLQIGCNPRLAANHVRSQDHSVPCTVN